MDASGSFEPLFDTGVDHRPNIWPLMLQTRVIVAANNLARRDM